MSKTNCKSKATTSRLSAPATARETAGIETRTQHPHRIHTEPSANFVSFQFVSLLLRLRLRLVPAARARVMLSSRLQFACVVRNQFENVPRAVRLVPLRRSSAHPHSERKRDTHAALRSRAQSSQRSVKRFYESKQQQEAEQQPDSKQCKDSIEDPNSKTHNPNI